MALVPTSIPVGTDGEGVESESGRDFVATVRAIFMSMVGISHQRPHPPVRTIFALIQSLWPRVVEMRLTLAKIFLLGMDQDAHRTRVNYKMCMRSRIGSALKTDPTGCARCAGGNVQYTYVKKNWHCLENSVRETGVA